LDKITRRQLEIKRAFEAAEPERYQTDAEALVAQRRRQSYQGYRGPSNSRRGLRVVERQSESTVETVDPGSGVSSDSVVAAINQEHALVILGNGHAIMKGRGNEVTFLKPETFKAWFAKPLTHGR
jgi:hypothetical protein